MTHSVLDFAPTTTTAPGAAGRLHFLDHLRAVIILLVIVLHASITYMVAPPPWWYVIAPKNSLLFTVVVLLVDVPIMQTLFFISGFFAYPSLEKHNPPGFLRQKMVRLGLPWLFGVVFLAPPVTYLITVTNGVAKPYLQFWATDFWGPYYQQSVYWYLGILLLLFAGLVALRDGEPRLQHLPRQPQMPVWTLFAKFWALTTLWYFVSSAVLPADAWLNAVKLFVFQPARLMLYAGYFGLGVYADRRGWFRPGGYQPNLEWWGPSGHTGRNIVSGFAPGLARQHQPAAAGGPGRAVQRLVPLDAAGGHGAVPALCESAHPFMDEPGAQCLRHLLCASADPIPGGVCGRRLPAFDLHGGRAPYAVDRAGGLGL